MTIFLSWIFLLIITAIIVICGVVAWAKLFGTDGADDAAARVSGASNSDAYADYAHAENCSAIGLANRQAVAAGDLDAVEFSVVPRGYRADQVDAVLAECQRELTRLRSELEHFQQNDADAGGPADTAADKTADTQQQTAEQPEETRGINEG
ncbi:DivIVA domain-containing protein [Corynebacterium propinquum]|uniref:DivIVA domain-containing protein n=1 Tax=Corynebacterium propinquum TaxID=43769 RepID=A0ABT7G0R2_9CORY|nr:DivIVA domain-containing protein [Corynebacterium propinquum]MDK4233946.1 DivIVA domain-containing protein [Corynebacterium propinquum]MDK4238853.1 DivIVA domain-containing protein [Corynebacterium propinquum]MDK4300322.1 DivIVA domain-containing protein [Corynebacterium propinquum]MDK4312923.1 DivIVA domain-containing protein [Corynebacterium propinquum]MDK8535919.1 DivIVA domain-containing protein [Corynebacterium propinquum]